jgi:hypothetical protein
MFMYTYILVCTVKKATEIPTYITSEADNNSWNWQRIKMSYPVVLGSAALAVQNGIFRDLSVRC